MPRSSLKFLLNGKAVVVEDPNPDMTILDYLPMQGLTGTKYACGEGGCGACTVLISRFEGREIRHYSVNGCLTLLCSVDGCHITTVEGIGSPDDPHPVQERIAKLHGSQCGYCTPGIVMALYSKLAETPKPTVRDIEESFDGNLCRCTGYRPIIDAAYTFASDAPGEVPDACKACPNKTDCLSSETATMIGSNTGAKIGSKAVSKEFAAFDPKGKHKPPTLPAEYAKIAQEELVIQCVNDCKRHMGWFRPANLEGLLAILKEHPHAKIIGGNSEAGVEVHVFKKHVTKPEHYSSLVSVQNIPRMHVLRVDEGAKELLVGSAVTLTALKCFFEGSPLTGDVLTSMNVFAALQRIITWFASQHIRNVATIGGNVCTGSPISDIMPTMIAVNALFVVARQDGSEETIPARQWLKGYRQTALQPGDALINLRIPLTEGQLASSSSSSSSLASKKGGKKAAAAAAASGGDSAPQTAFLNAYKQCRRRDDDISIVTSSFNATVDVKKSAKATSIVVKSLDIGFGGMGPTTIPGDDLAKAVVGLSLPLTEAGLDKMRKAVFDSKTLSLKPNVPGGMPAYRMTLVVSMCQRFLMDVERHVLGLPLTADGTDGADSYMSRPRPATHGTQQYAIEQEPAPKKPMDAPPPKPTKADESGPKPQLVLLTIGIFFAVYGIGVPYAHYFGQSQLFAFFIAVIMLPLEFMIATRIASWFAPAPQPKPQAYRGAVGEPNMHAGALLQCTGRAQYTIDLPLPDGAHHVCPVYSSRPTGKFTIGNMKDVLALPGVLDVVTAKDCPGARNKIGLAMAGPDEQLFREDTVTAQGQLIALVIAENLHQAIQGAIKFPITYEDKKTAPKPIVSSQQAIDAESYLPTKHVLEIGDVKKTFNRRGVVTVDGTMRIAGQEHFYMENGNCIAIPLDDGNEIELLGSTQGLNYSQKIVSNCTGIPMHRVKCVAKRLGGGFGGKETRSSYLLAAAAVAAKKAKCSIKFTLDRSSDMVASGTRHPFKAVYRIGVDRETLKIVAFEADMYANVGYAYDLSAGVVDRALLHSTNAYCIDNVVARGHLCKTASSNNTAFRGFGAPQGMAAIESAIEAVAAELGVAASEIRARNLLRSGDQMPYLQKMKMCHLPRMWDVMHTPEYGNVAAREAQIAKFNKKNKFVKRGLCVLPTAFGISFTVNFLNQGGCNVSIYSDGTVRVSSGGVEMGQGIYTKVCQVVATTLAIPLDRVFVSDTSTAEIPNATPTAASMSFDLYGAAALDACLKLNQRLERFLPKNWYTTDFPKEKRDAEFTKAVGNAYRERVDLHAHGFYQADHGYKWELPPAKRGDPFSYHTTGVCCAEVELDVLTGDMRVLRADVLMDLGVSPNPDIDVGQIEGAVMQGVGLFTLEETIWGSPDEHSWIEAGNCFTRGPGNYKIPSFNDVPVDMRVTLLADAPNPHAVFSSKAVGEPPLFLGAAAMFAARNAARAARADANCDTADALRHLDTPVSVERLRMFCNDGTASYFTKKNVEAGGLPQPAIFF